MCTCDPCDCALIEKDVNIHRNKYIKYRNNTVTRYMHVGYVCNYMFKLYNISLCATTWKLLKRLHSTKCSCHLDNAKIRGTEVFFATSFQPPRLNQLSHTTKERLYFRIESWLAKRDPYFMAYEIIPIYSLDFYRQYDGLKGL